MKLIICVLALAAVALARPEEKYTDKYDNINLDEILGNKKLLDAYVKCILEEPQARCTSEGKELKSHVRDAVQTDCSKCTESQRNGSEKVISHLIKHHEEAWTKLKAKYDPDGTYAKKNEARLAALA